MVGRCCILTLLILSHSLGCGSQPSVSLEGGAPTSTKTNVQTSTSLATSSSTSEPLEPSERAAAEQADDLGQASQDEAPPEVQVPQQTTGEASPENEAAPASDCIEPPSQWECDVEKEIAAIVSAERQSAGLNPLTLDPKLSWMARQWSTEQASRRSISHEWFQTGQLKAVYRDKFGADPRMSAENVAMVPCSQDARATAQSFMSGWMNSAGHRANILRNGQATIGVGIAASGGSCYGTQDFGL